MSTTLRGDVLEQLACYAPETNGNTFQRFEEACNEYIKGNRKKMRSEKTRPRTRIMIIKGHHSSRPPGRRAALLLNFQLWPFSGLHAAITVKFPDVFSGDLKTSTNLFMPRDNCKLSWRHPWRLSCHLKLKLLSYAADLTQRVP
jgi:hypothetical protein